MPNSRQTSVIDSPSSNFATNRRRSSITEHSFHGIDTSPSKAESVTHVSGTFCHLCLGPLSPSPVCCRAQQIAVRSLLTHPHGQFEQRASATGRGLRGRAASRKIDPLALLRRRGSWDVLVRVASRRGG